jgi:hypothetical protein
MVFAIVIIVILSELRAGRASFSLLHAELFPSKHPVAGC